MENLIERDPRSTDMEIALKLAEHIKNPCGTQGQTLRDFYIREAERVLGTLTNPGAVEFLKEIIATYRT